MEQARRERPRRRGTLALAAANLVGLTLAGAAIAQPQPEFATACVANANLAAGVHTYHTEGCEIAPDPSNSDTFKFAGTAGERVRLTAASSGAVNPTIDLQAPGGGSVGSASCPAAPCAATLDVTLGSSGTYTVTVGDGGANATGAYVLQLDRTFPLYCAPLLSEGVTVEDALEPIGDLDVLRVDGRAGDTVRVEVAVSDAIGLRAELVAPGGTTLRDESCAGPCTLMLDVTLGTTGIHHVWVSAGGAATAGPYAVTLSCLAGACLGDAVVDGLVFTVDNTTLGWSPVADVAALYDLSRGDLGSMRAGGSFAGANLECLGAPAATIERSVPDTPPAGQGFVYVARAVASDGTLGSADDRWGPGQVCGRALQSCEADLGRSCSAPVPIGPTGLVTTDNNCGAPNVVDTYFLITDPNDCVTVSGPAYPGPEVIYVVDLGPDNDVLATLTPNAASDLALFLITECGVGTSCVAFDDRVGFGVGEVLEPGPLPEGRYYLYVDSYYSSAPAGCGDYTLDFGGTLSGARLVDFTVD